MYAKNTVVIAFDDEIMIFSLRSKFPFIGVDTGQALRYT